MRRVCTSTRLRELRTLLRSHQLQAYINPSEDEHFSEYVDASDKRNAFISGFSGSVSTVIVTLDKAALWTDGRYHLQASHELDQNWTLMKAGLPSTLTEANWLVENTSPDSRIGYDPRLIPFLKIKHYQDELTEAEFKTNPSEGDHQIPSRQLIAVTDANLIDLAWDATSKMPMEDCSRPPRPANPIFSIPTSFSGDSWQTKLQRVRDQMLMKGAGMLVVSALDEIAWLLNLRGNDIQYNPVFYAHLIITMPRIDIFLTNTAMVESRDILNAQFSEDSRSIDVHPYTEFFDHLAIKISETSDSRSRVWLDHTASYAVVSRVPESRRLIAASPIASLKAVKTDAELAGIRQAHVTDSFVLCDFLAWLDETAARNRALGTDNQDASMRGDLCPPAGDPPIPAPDRLTEVSIAHYLDVLRSQSPNFVSLSFSTISAADANSSVIHYHPVPDQDSPVTNTSLYLVDSGGQYRTGTTDVTRTVHLHEPTDEEKCCYTVVLKAHIAVSSQVFPKDTLGLRLDILARRELWAHQNDFLHGTGHGVGAFLCVHEGPIGLSGHRITALQQTGAAEPGIQKNMVLTIEPGYYLSARFGIRLENVVFVVAAPPLPPNGCIPPSTGSATEWLTFDPVTLVPFQRKLIHTSMLSRRELRWINDYHATVRNCLEHYLLQKTGQTELDIKQLCTSHRRCWEWISKETEPFQLEGNCTNDFH